MVVVGPMGRSRLCEMGPEEQSHESFLSFSFSLSIGGLLISLKFMLFREASNDVSSLSSSERMIGLTYLRKYFFFDCSG